MAKYLFQMESDDFHEVVAFINAANDPFATVAEIAVAPVAEAEKPKQARKGKAKEVEPATAPEPDAAPETSPNSSSSETAAASAADEEEHPMLKSATFADITAKASAMLAADPASGAAIVAKLQSDFGARAFKEVKPEDYDRCMAMLEGIG